MGRQGSDVMTDALREHQFEPHRDYCVRCRRSARDIVDKQLKCEPASTDYDPYEPIFPRPAWRIE